MPSAGAAICGFDFGTSNSSIGRYVDGTPQLIEVQDGRVSVPTAMFFDFDDGQIYFGHEAVTRYLEQDEGRLMRALKGVLGSALIHEATQVAGSHLRFLDVISLFIARVRQAAGRPTSVVMGRPVRFVDDNEAADRDAEAQLRAAAEQAGFTSVAFQFEPIAAALDYERRVVNEQLAFVVDIGGGTSDFSIVRVSPIRRGRADRKSDILACSGVRIGGTDFDKSLNLRSVMPHLGMGTALRHANMEPPIWWYLDLSTWQQINFMYAPAVATDIRRVRRGSLAPAALDRLLKVIEERKGHAILAAVETAKIALSAKDAVVLELEELIDVSDAEITRRQLDEAIATSISSIMTRLQSTLHAAGIEANAIDAVFLTGGSSKLPSLRALVRKKFPQAEIVDGDAFGSVAIGLTIDARNRFGAE